jgi:hypothetical protein
MRSHEFIVESVDINSIAAGLEFLPTKKIPKKYKLIKDGVPGEMKPMSYTVAEKAQRVITITADGKETEKNANPGDIIMSGPSRENYVISQEKFDEMYEHISDDTVIPKQTPRMVAAYNGTDTVKFKAPWGEDMILKPGDYLVKETDGKGYYRIAAAEYMQTYNPPGH